MAPKVAKCLGYFCKKIIWSHTAPNINKTYFNSDVFTTPLSEPDLAITTPSYFFDHLDLPRDRPLHKVRQPRSRTGSLLEKIG